MKKKSIIIISASIIINAIVFSNSNAQFFGAPEKHFDEYEKPPKPDYSKESSWAALPDRQDAADVFPENSLYKENQPTAKVDVFYIHPTTYRNAKNWNQDINLEEVNTWTDLSRVSRQGSIFNACCKVFAPRYRQAAFGATSSKESGKLAYDFAYQDVLSAWKYYINNFNLNRPFIIVGHSQGALHAFTLIKEEIDKSKYFKNMVAAYIIGIPVLKGQIELSMKNTSICKKISDINCIISWNTFKMGSDASIYKKMAVSRLGEGLEAKADKGLVCWNPTSNYIDLNKIKPNISNLGPIPTVKKEGELPDLAEKIKAKCDDGILFASPPNSKEFDLFTLPGGSLHMHDMELFYENIRINSILRSKYYAVN